MPERITVSLSEETSQLLNTYCDKRQMNKSSASANFIVSGLEDWLANQRQLGRATKEVENDNNFDLSMITNSRNIINSKLSAHIRYELTGATLCYDEKYRRAKLPQNLVYALTAVTYKIIPKNSFSDTMRQDLQNATFADLLKTDIVNDLYNNVFTPKEKAEFDAFCIANKFPVFAERNDKDVIISCENAVYIAYILIHQPALNGDLYNQIDKYVHDNPNGKIIVCGSTGAGKTTLAFNIAKVFQAEITDPDEIRNGKSVEQAFLNKNLSVHTMHINDKNPNYIDRLNAMMLQEYHNIEDEPDLIKSKKAMSEAAKTTNSYMFIHLTRDYISSKNDDFIGIRTEKITTSFDKPFQDA